MATSSPPWIAPKKMIAATSIHIEFAKAIKISVRGINRQVVLFVTVEAP
jgi:hypothetical protein